MSSLQLQSVIQDEGEERDDMIATYFRVARKILPVYDFNSEKLFKAAKRFFRLKKIDFDNLDNYIAGVFRMEPAITQAIYQHTRSFFGRNEVYISGDGQMRILCLSDGTGFESIGVLRTFCESESFIGTATKFEITVLGRKIDWQPFFTRAVAEICNCKTGTIFSDYLKRKNVTSEYFSGDIEEYYGKNEQRAVNGTLARESLDKYVKDADVVIIARVLPYSRGAEITSIVEGVGRCMKKGGVLYLGAQERWLTMTDGKYNKYIKEHFITLQRAWEHVKFDRISEVKEFSPVTRLSYSSTILWKTG